MKITENKTIMILIMVVLIVGSTLFSGVHQVNNLAEKVNDEFINGEDNDGLSIAHDLQQRTIQAKRILTISKKCLNANDEEIVKAQEYINVLESDEDKSNLYDANISLQTTIDSIYKKVLDTDLDEKSLKELKQEKSIFDNALTTIGYDAYNQLVSEYEDETSGVMGNIFKKFSTNVEYFK